MKPIFIIEHLEPKLWEWCLIEYKHISKLVGKSNLWFTNINSKLLKNYGKTIKKSVKSINPDNACVLDPNAKKTLSTKEAKKFLYFIFGGILGDHPPKERTGKELSNHIKATPRNLGKAQFSTDSAVFVTKQIFNGIPLNKIKFKDQVEIKINEIESVILPYKYPIIKNKPYMSKDIINYLKNKKGF